MEAPLRWGIISTGRIAHTFASDLAFSERNEVVAVGSRTLESADAFADVYSVPNRHGSYAELVRDADVDVVYVATPHPMHFDDAMLAIEHGKPVLVEKAFTMNAPEARRLVSFARERGVFMMEAMWTRFLPHIVEIRRLLAEGALGDVVNVEADHGKWFELDPTSRLFAPALGGGAVLDLGVYPISFASMILGTPARVTAIADPAFTGVDGHVSMILGYEGGAQAVLSCTSAARSPTRASISGTLARIEVDGDFYAPTTFSLIKRSGETQRFEFETQGRGLHYEADEVARCIEAGLRESPGMPLDETVSIMETMDQVLAFL
jgi:predicted dehydrogenase